MDGAWMGLVAGAIVVAARLMRWRDQRLAPAADAPKDLRARLGDDLARWLMATRRLQGELAALGELARTIAAREQQALLIGARSMRGAHDESLSHELGEVTRSRNAWLQRADALGESDRFTVAALGLEAARVATAFELPWVAKRELEAAERAEELQAFAEQCFEASRSLAEIDEALSRPGRLRRR